MLRRFLWAWLALTLGCVDNSGLAGGQGGSTGESAPTSMDNGSATGADTGGGTSGSSGGTQTDATPEAGSPVEDPPTLGDPCGSDLEVHNGTVSPDFGLVAKGDAFSADPLERGPYSVTSSDGKVPNPDSSFGDIPFTIYGPSQDGKTIAEGKHPLVLVLPGYGKGFGITVAGTYPTYEFFSEHLVSHGFVVVGMNFVAGGVGLPVVTTANLGAHFLTQQEKNVAEVKAVLEHVLASEAKEHIDETKIAIGGHSEGGKVAFFVAVEDARIDVVLGWDPQNAGGGSPCGVPGGEMCDRLPIAPNCKAMSPGRMNELHAESLIFAARDAATIPDVHQHAEHFYRGAPSPAHMLLFPEAKTENWSDGENPVAQITMRAQAALLLTRFLGRTGLDDYLPGGKKLEVEGVTLEQHNK